MSHIPGPWLEQIEPRDDREEDQWVSEIRTMFGTLIAKVFASDKHLCCSHARLIARAPELLKALSIIELWTRNHPNGTCEAVHAKAVEAIAKAMGETDNG